MKYSTPTTAMVLFHSLLLFGCWTAATARVVDCPARCHCLPDPNDASRLKISCRWSHIPSSLPFVAFPRAETSSLEIHCDDQSTTESDGSGSTYSDEMFGEPFPDLQQLTLDGCAPANVHLPPGVFRGLTKLRSLHLRRIERVELDRDTFRPLIALETLSIVESNVERLPPSLLCDVDNLKMLNLTANLLSSVDAAGLSALEAGSGRACGQQLVLMDLAHNQLVTLAAGTFSGLATVHALRLGHNRLRRIELDAFGPTSHIKELWLDNNQLAEIHDLPSTLRKLDLSYNELSFMPPVVAERLPDLLYLNLSHNDVDGRSLSGLQAPHIQILDLSHNRLQSLPAVALANKTRLQQLDVSSNQLVELPLNAFADLQALTGLSLTDNRLTSVSGLQLAGLDQLLSLDLADNNLLNIDASAFAALPNLQRLGLAHNQLAYLPNDLIQLGALESLDLGANLLSSLPNFVFDKLTRLRRVDLRANKIGELPRYVFENCALLERLDLTGNQIGDIDDAAFAGCPSLVRLDLTGNRMTKLNAAFVESTSLRVLLLDGNQLKTLDRNQLPASLIRLSVTANLLTNITGAEAGDTAKPLSNLKHIDFSHNRLSAITSSTLPPSIVTVNASHNRIGRVDGDALTGSERLAELDLSHNLLPELRQDVFKQRVGMDQDASTTNMQYSVSSALLLYLAGNPLACSCRNEWLQSLDDYSTHSAAAFAEHMAVADMNDVHCTHLIRHERERLRDVPRAELVCPYESICTHGCQCCSFEGCDCKNVCPDGCRCYSDNMLASNIVQCTGLSPTRQFEPKLLPMYASEIYLDGMHLPEIDAHTFLGRFSLKRLYLNNSGVQTVHPAAFNGCKKLQVLDLSDNRLESWTGDEVHNTPYIEHLMLHGNRIQQLDSQAFAQFSHLKTLTLHDNEFQLLPSTIISVAPQLTALTLAGNPWRCDCADRFLIQRWLLISVNHKKVTDADAVYCEENLERHANDSGALAMLPATDGVTVRVNFWTFHQELNRTLCAHAQPAPVNQINAEAVDTDGMQSIIGSTIDRLGLLTVFVVSATLAAACGIILIVCVVMRRSGHSTAASSSSLINKSHHKSPGSLNSSATTTTTPILGHDVFITYSRADQRDVNEITSKLENEHPYYQVCLLHQHTSLNEFHQVSDEPLRLMDRAQCNIVYLSGAFLANEWRLTQTKILLSCLKTYKKYLIIILSPEIDLETLEVEDPLDKILRTTTRIRRDDPRFWELLFEALPVRMDDSASSTGGAYSYVYGTIKPSMLV